LLVLGAGLVAAGVLWLAFDPSRLVTETDEWRRTYLLERMRGYGWLLLAAGAVLAALGPACRPEAEARMPSPVFAKAPLAVLVAALVVAAWGVSHREWVRFERPCWDRYCMAGRWFSEWANGEVSTHGIVERLRTWRHANSFLGPLVFGTTARLADVRVVSAYRLLSAVCTVVALVVLHRGLLRQLHPERAVVWTAWWLAAAHPAVLRSFAFPQTDAMAMSWITGILALAFSARFWHSAARQVAAVVLATSGLFVKLTLAPALAFLPLAAALEWRPREGPRTGAWIARGALFAAVPVAVFVLVCFGLGFQDMLLSELHGRNTESDSAPNIVAEALVKALFPFAFWIWLGSRRWGPRERLLAAWTGLFLLVTFVTQTAGLLRYHVVALPAYVGLAVPGLAVLREQAGENSLAAVAAGMTVISFASLLANTYN
jgi:hypothetical protein